MREVAEHLWGESDVEPFEESRSEYQPSDSVTSSSDVEYIVQENEIVVEKPNVSMSEQYNIDSENIEWYEYNNNFHSKLFLTYEKISTTIPVDLNQ